MARLSGSSKRRVNELVYYCEKHGLLNKTADAKVKATEITKRPASLRTE